MTCLKVCKGEWKKKNKSFLFFHLELNDVDLEEFKRGNDKFYTLKNGIKAVPQLLIVVDGEGWVRSDDELKVPLD
ncbi:hypothetical protein [Psychrobacillus vulpis]|uniref:Glutaredoxin family protein n=1 Tax=Psychrobacillus vulpis TaxID=2325572 RepID=A0A544TPM8_9BACI|nr:hypothetical protein [Psychrobacillus vulpis]TQR19408.1 hypothetical protein FG384_12205 [Psychrobacillus vulpis]